MPPKNPEQLRLFTISPVISKLKLGYRPEVLPATERPLLSGWEVLILKYLGAPEASEPAEYWMGFRDQLPPVWTNHLDIMARQRLINEAEMPPSEVFKQALNNAAKDVIDEVTAEMVLNEVLDDNEKGQLVTHLDELSVSRRVERRLNNKAVFHTLRGRQVLLEDPDELASLNEEQLFALERLVLYARTDPDRTQFEKMLEADPVYKVLYQIAEADNKGVGQLNGCRAAWLKVNRFRRSVIKKPETLESYRDWKRNPVVQRQWLLEQAAKGAAGIGMAPEIGVVSLRTALGQVSTLIHNFIPEAHETINQPITGILNWLLKSYGEANQEMRYFSEIVPDWMVKQTYTGMHAPEGIKFNRLANAFRVSAELLAHLFMESQLNLSATEPNDFNTLLATIMDSVEGAGLDRYLHGNLFLKPESQLTGLLAANPELAKQWNRRPVITENNAATLNSTKCNLLTDYLAHLTNLDLLPLSRVFNPDAGLFGRIRKIVSEKDSAKLFLKMERTITKWIEEKYPADVIRSTFALMIITDILKQKPMEKFSGHLVPEVLLEEAAHPGHLKHDGDLYADALVFPEVPVDGLKGYMSDGTGVRVPAALGELAKLLPSDTIVLPVEYKILISAKGAGKLRTRPRTHDLEQMNGYLAKIHKLYPGFKIPKVIFAYFTVSGISEINVAVDPETGLLPLPAKPAKQEELL